MKIDLNKIETIYSTSSIYELKDHLDEVVDNMNYLVSRGINDIYFVVETNPYIFLNDKKIFKRKVDNLINRLGVEYIEKLDNNFSLWGDLND